MQQEPLNKERSQQTFKRSLTCRYKVVPTFAMLSNYSMMADRFVAKEAFALIVLRLTSCSTRFSQFESNRLDIKKQEFRLGLQPTHDLVTHKAG
jgi:hypothetical protein